MNPPSIQEDYEETAGRSPQLASADESTATGTLHNQVLRSHEVATDGVEDPSYTDNMVDAGGDGQATITLQDTTIVTSKTDAAAPELDGEEVAVETVEEEAPTTAVEGEEAAAATEDAAAEPVLEAEAVETVEEEAPTTAVEGEEAAAATEDAAAEPVLEGEAVETAEEEAPTAAVKGDEVAALPTGAAKVLSSHADTMPVGGSATLAYPSPTQLSPRY